MKKLSKLKLAQNAELMNDSQMKMIVGGAGDGSYCGWEDCRGGGGCIMNDGTYNPGQCGFTGTVVYTCECGLLWP